MYINGHVADGKISVERSASIENINIRVLLIDSFDKMSSDRISTEDGE